MAYEPPKLKYERVQSGIASGAEPHVNSMQKEREATSYAENFAPNSAVVEENSAPIFSEKVETQITYVTGWKLLIAELGMFLLWALVLLGSSSIASTLGHNSKHFQKFDRAHWVMCSCALSFIAFISVYSRVSDVVGRKPVYVFAVTLFSIFSIACGAAPSMNALIVLRSFQGLGASEILAINWAMLQEMVPRQNIPKYIGLALIFVISGEMLGYVCATFAADLRSWRWLFYMNGPLGLVSIICAASAMARTPFQPHYSASTDSFHVKVARTLKETDWVGLSLVAMTCVSMILGIEQLSYSWKGPATIVLLVLSVISLCLFIAIERHISNTGHIFGLRVQPFYPWHLLKRRPLAFTCLYSFLKGYPLFTVIIVLPLYFQLVESTSAGGAAVRILPLYLAMIISTIVLNEVLSIFHIPLIFGILVAMALQSLGLALLSLTMSSVHSFTPMQYFLEFVIGAGLGPSTVLPSLYADRLGKLFSTSRGWTALGSDLNFLTTTSIISQLYFLGGMIGFFIGEHIYNAKVRSALSFAQQASRALHNATRLAPILGNGTGTAMSYGYNLTVLQLEALKASPWTLVEFPEEARMGAREVVNQVSRLCLQIAAVVAAVSALAILASIDSNWRNHKSRSAFAKKHV